MTQIRALAVKDDLKRKILDEMTVEYSDSLEETFDLAKQFIPITRDGGADVLVRDKVSGRERGYVLPD